jgi:DNA mismatch repair protein MutL
MTRIQVLPPEEARKIAAGEVIDRPAALVREFMDNAIDAGGVLIEVSIEGGGITKTEISDDGEGMSREDLEVCCLTHATSKIHSMEDLKSAETLGFRGEALAAAAAVSRLEILSSRDGREAWKLTTGPAGADEPRLEQARRTKGSSVRALGLFDTIPARKRFLKREGAEALVCRQIFTDKALAFPGIGFRFVQDGALKVFLPPAASYKERFCQAVLSRNEAPFVHEIAAQGPGFSVIIVAGGPEITRPDKRQEFIFANGRRVQDYSLVQALEYGLQGFFPNGLHPAGAVFVSVDPALADFNIHPAKREVRFADAGAIHHAVTSALRDFSRHAVIELSGRIPGADAPGTGLSGVPLPLHPGLAGRDAPRPSNPLRAGSESSRHAMEALLADPPAFSPLPGRSVYAAETNPAYTEEEAANQPGGAIRYLGRVFELFILIEKEGALYIIDQHAAHERILYNRFLKGPIPKQELLVPIPFTAESEEDDRFLRAGKDGLEKLGVVITEEDGRWRIEALPSDWRLNDAETVEEILNLRTAGENMAERWAATLSCHSAVRDGDYLDRETALALAEEALSLPVPLCPHGRPLWMAINREDLFRAVKRT